VNVVAPEVKEVTLTSVPVVARVPDVGKVTFVVPVEVNVVANAPDVIKELPSAIVKVEPLVGAVIATLFTDPVKSPTKAVEVIEVAPVTTPASTLIVPSNTIAEPVAGVMFTGPVEAVTVFPSIPILSTANAVSVPTLVIAGCAAAVTVAALPDALPVKSPVKTPAIAPAPVR